MNIHQNQSERNAQLKERIAKIADLAIDIAGDFDAASIEGQIEINSACAHLIAAKHGLFAAHEIAESLPKIAEVV